LNCLWVLEINSCWIELPHSWKWVICYPCLKDLESLPIEKAFWNINWPWKFKILN
jgi:hypothetical protein